MASRSVALVNRLRLGEAPNASDCALAGSLLALDGAAADFLDLAADLEATAAGDAGSRRLRVRLALLVDICHRLSDAAAGSLADLSRYFTLRADVDGDSQGAEEGPEPDDEVATSPETGRVAAALADLAVPARVGESLDLGLRMLSHDCRRVREGLGDLLEAQPDVERALDALSGLEADLQHALYAVLRPDFAEGELPYRPGLAQLAAAALEAG